MRQTAVKWLQQALEDTILDHEQIMQTIGLFEQAKEMEKEQMVDFVIKWMGEDDLKDDIIKHYNETFNTNEK
jgi:hypothetical protein